MSDSVRPHRRQPIRLPCPWDSPGKNTGVGCHFLLQCMKWKVKVKLLSCVRLFETPWTAAYQAPPSMGFSRQEYWSGVPLLAQIWALTILLTISYFLRHFKVSVCQPAPICIFFFFFFWCGGLGSIWWCALICKQKYVHYFTGIRDMKYHYLYLSVHREHP